jgi:preprotein translocase subunit SecB
MNKEKIKPEIYRKILQGINIENISIKKAMFDCKTIPEDTLNINVESTATFANVNDQTFTVQLNYILNGKTEDNKGKLEIKCEYELVYSTTQPVDDSFFDIFKDIHLQTAAWPFFREFVYSMTSRMYLPPFTLPLIKR